MQFTYLLLLHTCAQECYRNTVISSDWHRKLEFPNGDLVVIHSPTVILHVTGQSQGASWTSGHEVIFIKLFLTTNCCGSFTVETA